MHASYLKVASGSHCRLLVITNNNCCHAMQWHMRRKLAADVLAHVIVIEICLNSAKPHNGKPQNRHDWRWHRWLATFSRSICSFLCSGSEAGARFISGTAKRHLLLLVGKLPHPRSCENAAGQIDALAGRRSRRIPVAARWQAAVLRPVDLPRQSHQKPAQTDSTP